MLRYIARRLLWLIFVLVVIVAITYSIFFLLPGGNTDTIAQRFAGKAPQPEVVQQVKIQMGLDKPIGMQFVYFMKHLFFGDQYGWPGFGKSFTLREPLRPILIERMFITLQLALGAAVMWLLIGIPIGCFCVRPRSLRPSCDGFALVGISIPVFVLGPMACGCSRIKRTYSRGPATVLLEYGFWPWFSHFLLPWFVLALLYAAFYARLSRANLLDTMGEDYMRTARAKGLRERRVIVHHGLRSSLTPLVTVFGLDLAGLLAGAVITETIFNIPGIGDLAIKSIQSQDLYAILDVTIIAAFIISFANLAVDIVYAFLDPRVRYE